MPATAMFYHLTRAGLTDTVAMILPRALGQGWRVMLRCPDAAQAARLDEALWLPDDSFLPHALATGSAADAGQPVLIGPGPMANDPQGLVLVSGAAFDPGELTNLQRLWILFDGNDPDAVAAARLQWTAATTQGLGAQYWTDDSGTWVKKTERAPAS
jgi:DNA polymerase III subunit chi